jgi:hypothetical protein
MKAQPGRTHRQLFHTETDGQFFKDPLESRREAAHLRQVRVQRRIQYFRIFNARGSQYKWYLTFCIDGKSGLG